MEEFKEGDWVKFNGSIGRPRWYAGQVKEVKEKTYLIVDDEWGATSEVVKTRVRRQHFKCHCCGVVEPAPHKMDCGYIEYLEKV